MITTIGSRSDTRTFLKDAAMVWAVTLQFLRRGVLTALQYRVSFILQVVGMILNNTVWVLLWFAFFDRFNEINGWGYSDSLLLFSIGCIIMGLANLFAGGIEQIARKIERGELDSLLLLPGAPLWHLMTSRLLISGIGDVVSGVIFGWYGVEHDLGAFAVLLVASLFGAVAFVAAAVIFQSIAFFTSRWEAAAGALYWGLATFTLYPATIFGGVLKLLTFTVLPAFFVVHLPVSLVRSFSWSDLLLQCAGTSVLCVVAVRFFNSGLRRYESGNLLTINS